MEKPVARRNPKQTNQHQHQDEENTATEMMLNYSMWITLSQTQKHSHMEAMLYIFEDTEAVIKMIIEGRSPTMRHVSRTHRVALDWLFNRINLEPKIPIKYVDTKNQLADILTKGSFSRHERNHLLSLFNVMNFSMYSCSHFSNFLSDNSDQVGKQSAMSKRGQKTTSNEGSPTAKAKPLVNPGNTDETKEVEIASRNLVLPDNRIFSSESTRECSNSIQETVVGGSKPNRQR